ncbi:MULTISPECIES: PTS sugar transporter subunit IIB [Tepidanaerobacter]|uniref:PTS system, mannose-specific IIB component n=1 Tax=Tepidanaerobacter syntrophicus TaxID=224999 RepID=A0A0U9HEQ4_9FIRM|nr:MULTISPECIES: PTS sugar transporter subunit IIB [Tepidanaerobacter]GAQ25285.1 PTS system, mannose-specific IIB component [Tepidanaerobacter syntrophicus]
MLLQLRVDDRLLHGQVGTAWTPKLQADMVIIANDKVSNNSMLKMTMSLAKPAGVDLKILTINQAIEFLNDKDGKLANRRVFIITESIQDAALLVEHVKDLNKVNLGGIRQSQNQDKVKISKQVFLNEQEMKILSRMAEKNVEIFEQIAPLDPKKNWENIQKLFSKGGGKL